MAERVLINPSANRTLVHVVTDRGEVFVGYVEAHVSLDALPTSTKKVRFFSRHELPSVELRKLVSVVNGHPTAMSLDRLRERLGGAKTRPAPPPQRAAEGPYAKAFAEFRAKAKGLTDGLAEGLKRLKNIRRLVQTLRNVVDGRSDQGRRIRRAGREALELLKKLRKGGKITKGSLPALSEIVAALVKGALTGDQDSEALKELLTKALRGMKRPELKDVIDQVNAAVRKVIGKSTTDDRLSRLAETIHRNVSLPLTKGDTVRGKRTRTKKDILETLRKQLKGGVLSRFLEGLDTGLGKAIGQLEKAQGKLEALDAVLEAFESGEPGSVKEKMRTYRQLRAVVMGVKATGLLDKLPPGLKEMLGFYVEVFIALDEKLEIIAKYAVRRNTHIANDNSQRSPDGPVWMPTAGRRSAGH